ncbi:hypothetical protein CDL12_16214 [Handroanthus impetiginosus]|uniref:Uncharacterized protein n=1 Tax=Handroanthus impetiginosus TaxID=429701 RepID=A0A2G9H101_9LAMI|nr:hypothetical protein CDL12_16214 [Handroanthus impetiginosus]
MKKTKRRSRQPLILKEFLKLQRRRFINRHFIQTTTLGSAFSEQENKGRKNALYPNSSSRKEFSENLCEHFSVQFCEKMPLSLSRLPFSRFFRQLEQDMETVVKVLQPGPLGIIEHKFTAEEINRAHSTVNRAVENWRRTAYIERNNPILKDFVDNKTPIFQNPR